MGVYTEGPLILHNIIAESASVSKDFCGGERTVMGGGLFNLSVLRKQRFMGKGRFGENDD